MKMSLRNPLVCEATSAHLAHEPGEPFRIRLFAGGVSEVELGQVSGQMFGGNMMVSAVDGPLELRKKVLGEVGALPVDNVLTSLVIDPNMLGESLTYREISRPRIGRQCGPDRVGILEDFEPKSRPVDPWHDGRSSLAAIGVDERDDGNLPHSASASACHSLVCMPVLVLPTDVRLIRHDGRIRHAGDDGISLHGLPDTVEHEPCGVASDPVLTLNLAGSDTVLGGNHLEEHKRPLAKGDLRSLEHGASDDRELLPASAALPPPSFRHGAGASLAGHAVGGCQVGHVGTLAVGANGAVNPSDGLKELVGSGLGRNQ